MANLLLNEADAVAVLWAIENTLEDQGEWFETYWPSDVGRDWLQHAMEIRLRIERLATMLRERQWPDWKRAEQMAKDADALAATILRKCALDSERMSQPRAQEKAAS